MKRTTILTGVLLALIAGGAVAQEEKQPKTGTSAQGAGQGQAGVTAGAGTDQSSATVAQGTEISATLSKPVDAGKARPGDEVSAKAAKDITSGGKVVVPRGSRLIGRVTNARPHGEGSAGGSSASELGIVFDRAVLKDGSEVALNGAVAAIGAARTAGSAGGSQLGGGAGGAGSAAGSAGGSGGGLAGTVGGTVGGTAAAATSAAGGIGATVGGTVGAAGRSADAIGGFDAAGGLRPGSRGVFGMRDLEIASSGSGSAEGSIITSAHRDVRIAGGTQLLLVAGGSAQAADKPREPVREPVDRR